MVQLAIALSEEPEDHIQAAAAWALGQIGRHTPEHAKAVAVANVLPKLLQCYLRADASEDLQTKVHDTFDWNIYIILLCLGWFLGLDERQVLYSPYRCQMTGENYLRQTSLKLFSQKPGALDLW